MKPVRLILLNALMVVGLGPAAAFGAPVGTAFTYQGELLEGGVPVDEPVDGCEFEFSLWDDPLSVDPAALVGSAMVQTIEVASGRFSTTVDFGMNIFTGEARWLEIAVCCPAPCVPGLPLTPRQELTPAPHALALSGLWTQQNATSPNLIGGHSANTVAPDVVGATISGGGAINSVTGDYGTIGGGKINQAGDDDGDPTTAIYGTVGGGYANTARATQATVGGGFTNTASGETATVGGGKENTATANQATVSGGVLNNATGFGSVVGGGGINLASNTYATIAGGQDNTASGTHATVGGGRDNTVTANYGTVPGGWQNHAEGYMSFAAGWRAKVRAGDDGSFVWSDLTTMEPDFFESTGPNQFLINATGGVGIGTDSPTPGALTVAGMVESTSGGLKLPDGTIIDDASDLVGAGAATLDEAYDGGAAGAGRIITADSGAVEITGSDGLLVAGTITSGSSITIDGTADAISSNGDLELHVSSGRAVRIEPHATSPNLIGGYSGNNAATGVLGATISGGGESTAENRIMGDYGTVGGGKDNQAGGLDFATVGGGGSNTAEGFGSAIAGGISNNALSTGVTVAGGLGNQAGPGEYATVGGGFGNIASGDKATVGGGSANIAGGEDATVPGGRDNTAAGAHSFAAGQRAKANHQGAFVWADSTVGDFTSTSVDQFLIRATGGVGIGTDNPAGYALNVNGPVNATDLLINGAPVSAGISGGGTANYLPKFTGPTAVGDSIVSDDGAIVGIEGAVMFGSGAREFELREVTTSDPGWGSLISYGGIGIGSEGDTNRQIMMFTDGAGSQNIFTIATSENAGSTWEADFAVSQNGRVGIGTTAPGAALEVGDGIGVADVVISNGGLCVDTDGNCSAPAGGLRVGTGGILGTNSSGDDVLIVPAGPGNVGIGTAPDARLHVDNDTGDAVVVSGNSAQVTFREATGIPTMQVRADGDGPSGDQISRLSMNNLTGDVLRMFGHATYGSCFEMSRSSNTNTVEIFADLNGNSGAWMALKDATGATTISLNGTTGRVTTEVLQITGADLAEKFPVAEAVKPGWVMEIDPDHPGQLRVARGSYNRRVAGVVSGANNLPAGVILGNLPESKDAPPIALSGRVWTLCDASNGPIVPGDLLTTSEIRGHAMRVTKHADAQGAIIGKAMSSLDRGVGLVLVLVSLQ